eukprot:scaffold306123_cov15-Tisochrysis_lutea.AAC.1
MLVWMHIGMCAILDAAADTAHGDLLVWVHIGMRAMLDDAGKGELANALGAAARAVPQCSGFSALVWKLLIINKDLDFIGKNPPCSIFEKGCECSLHKRA